MVGVVVTLCLSEVCMTKKKGMVIVHLIILKKNSTVMVRVTAQKICLGIEEDRNENTVHCLRQD